MTGERTGGGQRGARRPAPPGGSPEQAGPAGQDSWPGDTPLLDQAFDASSMYQLRAAVAAHAGHAGLSRTRADDLVVAVHELAANVVRHGSGRGRLIVWRDAAELHCQVAEEGGQQAAGARGDPPWRIQPGHGLWLVREIADRTQLLPGPDGVTSIITFRLRPAP